MVTAATTARLPAPSCTLPTASLWIRPATYTSPTLRTTASARFRAGSSPRWRETGRVVTAATTAQPPAPRLHWPEGVAVDSAGNLYIADTYNIRIRKVSNGAITTVAGGGSSLGDNGPATSAVLGDPEGVAVGSAGNLYIADTYNDRIRRLTPVAVPSVPAINVGGIVNAAS